jgi:hypothetical protein
MAADRHAGPAGTEDVQIKVCLFFGMAISVLFSQPQISDPFLPGRFASVQLDGVTDRATGLTAIQRVPLPADRARPAAGDRVRQSLPPLEQGFFPERMSPLHFPLHRDSKARGLDLHQHAGAVAYRSMPAASLSPRLHSATPRIGNCIVPGRETPCHLTRVPISLYLVMTVLRLSYTPYRMSSNPHEIPGFVK